MGNLTIGPMGYMSLILGAVMISLWFVARHQEKQRRNRLHH